MDGEISERKGWLASCTERFIIFSSGKTSNLIWFRATVPSRHSQNAKVSFVELESDMVVTP